MVTVVSQSLDGINEENNTNHHQLQSVSDHIPKAHYIFLTGGVVSSLGKGIVVASLGRMLKNRGANVALMKLDPYLNVDPGTMSPYQHGEVFVTADGAETDLDLGHYERFTNIEVSHFSNITSGGIYESVIQQERDGKTGGDTVQITPHVTNQIKERIWQLVSHNRADVVIIEVGGTVGDIEGQPFLEAIRQLRNDKNTQSALYMHLTLVPFLKTAGELKTKPTQHSVQELRRAGVQPDAVICRGEHKITDEVRKKIAQYCDVPLASVIGLKDLPSVYLAPSHLEAQGLGKILAEKYHLPEDTPEVTRNIANWNKIAMAIANNPIQITAVGETEKANDKLPAKPIAEGNPDTPKDKSPIKVALVGKYVQLADAYRSVLESMTHSAAALDFALDVQLVQATDIEEKGSTEILHSAQAIIVPGGFGKRGLEGMVTAAQYARENGIPYFGLCLGLHAMVVEFARNVLNLKDANSAEVTKPTQNPVISLMPDQTGRENTGGTMRLGRFPCRLVTGSKAQVAYNTHQVGERHRHRYEVNTDYLGQMHKHGLIAGGFWDERNLAEIMELVDHKFMLGVQFHPEFLSRPDKPHPLFTEFLRKASEMIPVEGQFPLNT